MKNCLRWLTLFLGIAVLIGCDRSSKAPVTDNSPAQPASTAAPAPGLDLVHSTYAAQWVDNNIPAAMRSGVPTPVQVRVKNTGDWTWPDAKAAHPSKPDGSYAVRLTYRWVGSDKTPLPENSGRGEISAPVPAGGTASFSIEIIPPKESGSYQLQLDLVQELVTFFSAKGVEKLSVPVTVQ
jgi:hypothetical protein